VSVLTPAYNAAEYLPATIESVLNQSFSSFELLIVDDGSTDGTAEIARSYARQDPRVKVVGRPNGGISAARNTGLRRASGAFIALLDSDDSWAPVFLARQLDLFARFPDVDVVTANAWNCGGELDGTPVTRVTTSPRRITFADMLEDEQAVCIMSVFRRHVPERIGGFDERLRRNEDYDFWLRAAHSGFVFLTSPEPLARYRRRPDSVSANTIAMLTGIIDVLERWRPICAGSPREEAAIDRQIARFSRERLLARAKMALSRGDARGAARELDALGGFGRDALIKLLARAGRISPDLLLWAYRLRAMIAGGRRTATPAGAGSPRSA
jgi:hypothetical protein